VDLTSWERDIQGRSGVVSATDNVTFTNISFCPHEPCFRAQITPLPSMKSSIIPSNNGLYWFGFSSLLPASSLQQPVTYLFSLLGGDSDSISSRSPMLGLYVSGLSIHVVVCGNTAESSAQSSCRYFTVGDVKTQVWDDWVIEDNFSTSQAEGYLRIWRNQTLVVSVFGLLTAYMDIQPHFVKLGAHVPSWEQFDDVASSETTPSWSSVSFSSIRIGGESSYYAEVYTGNDVPMNSEFTLSPTVQPSGVNESRESNGFAIVVFLVVATVCVLGMSCSVMCGSVKPSKIVFKNFGYSKSNSRHSSSGYQNMPRFSPKVFYRRGSRQRIELKNTDLLAVVEAAERSSDNLNSNYRPVREEHFANIMCGDDIEAAVESPLSSPQSNSSIRFAVDDIYEDKSHRDISPLETPLTAIIQNSPSLESPRSAKCTESPRAMMRGSSRVGNPLDAPRKSSLKKRLTHDRRVTFGPNIYYENPTVV